MHSKRLVASPVGMDRLQVGVDMARRPVVVVDTAGLLARRCRVVPRRHRRCPQRLHPQA